MLSIPEPKQATKSFSIWLLEPIRQAFSLQTVADPRKNIRALFGLLGSCFSLLLLRFMFMQDEQWRWVELASALGADQAAQGLRDFFAHPLGRLSFWVFGCLICYALIPMLFIRLVLGDRIKDYGGRGFSLSILPGLLTCLVIMAPLVWFASGRPRFLSIYPFYEPARDLFPAWDFFLWEILYALQFLALEFFFRGFMIHSTAPALGPWAIPVMVIPYCMIHFQKPFLEATAAIPAGLFLGWLGLKTGSILPGAILHILVAWSMDLLALSQKGYWG